MSCEFQEEKAREYCDYWDFDVLDVYRDKAASGKRADNRPGLEKALVHVCKVRGALVVYNLARLSRSLKDLVEISHLLDKKHADIVLVTEHVDTKMPMGRFYFHMMAILGQWQREISQKPRFCTQEQRFCEFKRRPDEGQKNMFGAHFGARLVIPNIEEGHTIKLIVNLHNQGMSVREICDELTRRGRKPRGKAWYPMTITRILDRHTD
jgi:DNA invertase Pin-like site-specific DNA recombinase